jgi:hypothetical protein
VAGCIAFISSIYLVSLSDFIFKKRKGGNYEKNCNVFSLCSFAVVCRRWICAGNARIDNNITDNRRLHV